MKDSEERKELFVDVCFGLVCAAWCGLFMYLILAIYEMVSA